VAAEDEVRAARRELRDARARLEALKRAQRTGGGPAPAPLEAGDATATARVEWEPEEEDRTSSLFADPDRERFTTADADAEAAPEEPAPVAVDPTEPMDAEDLRDEAADAETAVVPRPRTPGARRTIRLEPHDDDVLDPAAVGARYIEPAETRPPLLALTPARIAVGAALLVLLVALVVIFAGGGPV
jgi:hypothetical protein